MSSAMVLAWSGVWQLIVTALLAVLSTRHEFRNTDQIVGDLESLGFA